MNISEITTYYNNNKIVFVLKVPLVNSQNYELYHNIPYPTYIINDTYATIIPSSKYLAITRDRSYYSKLDNSSNSKSIYSLEIYSCFRTPICKSDIISKTLKSVPVNCKTQFLRGQLDIWQPLSNNRWIFVISTPSKISIDCQNRTTTEQIISDTGILNLPSYCKAFYKDSRLIPKYIKTIKIKHTYNKYQF